MTNRFPKDCDKNCSHYSQYDMSIDDYVATCGLLKMECDLCDQEFNFTLCPLYNTESED